MLAATRPAKSKAYLDKVSQATRELAKTRDELTTLEDGRPATPLLTAGAGQAGQVAILGHAVAEIKALIGTSVATVTAGSKLVGDAGSAMADIVERVRRVADLIEQIRTASAEQTTGLGLGLVIQAVGQIDRVTQQNASLVGQSAAAAESLKDQADRLVGAVSLFNLGGETGLQVRPSLTSL